MPDRLSAMIASLTVSTMALRNGAIRRVMLGFWVFNAVEIGAWTAILIYAYQASGPAAVGFVAVIQLVPSALLAPVLAGIGDRFRRDRVLVGWYLVQALAVGGVGAAIGLHLPALVVYAISTVATITMTQTRPVQAALLPEIVHGPGELTASNALASMGEGVGAFLGPLGVGIVLSLATLGATFLAGGLALLGAALTVVRIDLHAGPRPDLSADADAGEAAFGPTDLLAGLRLVARDRDLRVVMALLTARLVVFGGLEVLVVLLAIDLLGIGESGAGYLMGALGVGAILGGAGAFALVGRRRLAPWLGIAAVAIGIPIALIGFAPAARTAAILLALAGVGIALLDVAGQTLLQRITPDAIRARAFGILEGLQLLGEALGSMIVGPIAVLFGLQAAAIALGLLLPIAAAVALPRFARIDARAVVPEAGLRVLRLVPIFAPLDPASLEAVARHLVLLGFREGDVLIREGEPGDRWYVIRAGRVRVTASGSALRELGPGDAFGEIALLYAVPRTATVTAIEGGSCWALDRVEFLAAVTGSPVALAEAERLASERIGGH